jgi:hypothetical protein
MTDTRQPVAPKEGHYAMLRNGCVVHPECITKEFDLDGTHYYLPANSDEDYHWTPQGVCQRQAYPNGVPKIILVPDCDIIATSSPAAIALAARLEADGHLKGIDDLIKTADAACDYADQHCRAFPIATAPIGRDVSFWDSSLDEWQEFTMLDLSLLPASYTHWRESFPPPSNPPLSAVFVELGAALEGLNTPT